jgi:N-methylhydantoinase A
MGVIRIADANMINALKLVSVRRGYDPRDFVLIAFGGGGAMHAGALMRELRVKKVIIPTEPAVFSAWGMLMTDLRRDYIRTLITRTDQVEPERLNNIFGDMEHQALNEMAAEGVKEHDMTFQRFADMRYMGQEHTVKVPLPGSQITAEVMPDAFILCTTKPILSGWTRRWNWLIITSSPWEMLSSPKSGNSMGLRVI